MQDDAEVLTGPTLDGPHLMTGAGDELSGSVVPPAGTFIGRYVVIAPVGRGGMANVVSARDPLLNRTVALKLLTVTGDEARVRLMREAQAMARIRHPNVVSVFDFGDYGGGVFLAMEYVEGGTLRTWRRTAPGGKPRSVQAVLAMYAAAGRGLAAAHRAGLVHRDFKPENVLIDASTGDPRVTDFGLAQGMGRPPTSRPLAGTEGASADAEPHDLLSAPNTTGGVVEGTPQYMAPEQHLRLATDARADQFSFCVSLFEALAEARPFRAVTRAELVGAMERGDIDAAALRRIPAWLEPVLVRGLAWKPEERYPSLEDLLRALGRESAPRRRSLLVGVGLGVAALAFGVGYAERGAARARQCLAEGDAIRESFNPVLASAAQAAFERSGVPDASSTWERTRAVLEGYASAWSEAAMDACKATVVDGRQSTAVLRERRACLDGRRAELAAMTRVFVSADAKAVRKAFEAASSLSPIATCADADADYGGVTSPSDPQTAERVAELRRTLAEAKALADADRGVPALEHAAAVVDEARRIDFKPLLAEALAEEGRATMQAESDAAKSVSQLEESFALSLSSRSFTTAGRAAVVLTRVEGHVLGRHKEGHTWARLGSAALAGASSLEADDIRLRLLVLETNIYNEEEATADALRTATEARRIASARPPADRRLGVRVRSAMAIAYATAGDTAASLTEFEAALTEAESLAGANDPLVADRLTDLAAEEFSAGEYARAESHLDRAVTLNERVRSADHLNVAISVLNRGEARRFQGRCAEALEDYARARSIYVARLGADTADLLGVEIGSAECLRRRHDLAAAREAVSRASRFASSADAVPASVAEFRFVQAKVLADTATAGDDARQASATNAKALELARKARDYYVKEPRVPATRILLDELEAWLGAHDTADIPDAGFLPIPIRN